MKRWQKYLFFSILLGNLCFKGYKACQEWLNSGKKTKPASGYASLCLAGDEILVDILTESREMGDLLALSTLSDNPRYSFLETQITSRVPHRSDQNLERLIELSPSLVITASFNRLSLVNILRNSGIQTLHLNRFHSLEDLYGNYRLVGRALHRETEAERVVQKLDRALGHLRSKETEPVKTLIWLGDGTLVGPKTLIHDVLTLTGGENILGREFSGWTKPSLEKMAQMNPSLILSICENGEEKSLLAKLRNHPSLSHSFAVKNSSVSCLSPKEFSTQSSHILETAKKLNRIFHESHEKKSS